MEMDRWWDSDAADTTADISEDYWTDPQVSLPAGVCRSGSPDVTSEGITSTFAPQQAHSSAQHILT